MNFRIFGKISASLAQLVEQLIRNEQVVGSSPMRGSERDSIGREVRSRFFAGSPMRGSLGVAIFNRHFIF